MKEDLEQELKQAKKALAWIILAALFALASLFLAGFSVAMLVGRQSNWWKIGMAAVFCWVLGRYAFTISMSERPDGWKDKSIL